MGGKPELHPSSAYIPITPKQEAEMLEAIGVSDKEDLFQDIPPGIRNPFLGLRAPVAEMELVREMSDVAEKNIILPSFLGFGTYRRFQPAIVRAIIGRDEFLTSYTPYRPEISQGTLQAAFEYQTMMCDLYGMDVSNTGMYDGATAMAEAALMAVRIHNPRAPGEIFVPRNRPKVVALNTVHPEWLDVTRTYLSGRDIELVVVGEDEIEEESKDTSGVIVQSPNFLGNVEDLVEIGETAHTNDALFIVVADPISLGMFETPGEYGADIAVGEGQSLGHLPNFGGVNLGIFTAKEKYVREMPGRIVGKTQDEHGRTGYVLTLQTREQHIRREKSTSNICTAEQLIALASTVYLAALGEQGLRAVAERNYRNTHYLASKLLEKGFNLPFADRVFFNEFVVEVDNPSEVNKRLLGKGFIGGKDISNWVPNGMLLCATETLNRRQIDEFVEAFAAAA